MTRGIVALTTYYQQQHNIPLLLLRLDFPPHAYIFARVRLVATRCDSIIVPLLSLAALSLARANPSCVTSFDTSAL